MDNAIRAMEAKREENLSAIRAKRQQKAEHLRNAEAIDKEIATFQKLADEYTAAVKALKATQGNPALVVVPDIQQELKAEINRYQAEEMGAIKAGAEEAGATNVVVTPSRRGRPPKGSGKFDVGAVDA